MKKNEIATAHKKHKLRNDGVGRYGIKRQKTKKAVIATNIFVKEMFG
ncbi:MAG: hypothetical protein ACUZ8H_08915 [Candidatus Anammoxibacter sp.]